MTGCLVAVVGPSGSGKDAVLGWARERLAEAHALFPRRVVTRPAGPGEEHEPCAPDDFAARADRGEFAVRWEAHGLSYGVPASVARHVADGGVAVVNVSRGVLPSLADVFGRVRVVRVTVPEEVRRERILARGREGSAAAEARLSRPDPAPDFPVDLEIVNDAALSTAGARLVALVESLRLPA
ncbi:phosphonate metabolism protein/1,5-bisphosphokinase (PRPP-forming) PhnN [Microbacterium sp. gxy059]|uniref:phosphonate metabolism protein/1,5-bisphosphokinase (PRPP-forming) PhnN n=1 Tax=Microbacterium sp. gxy059 TaxID=2957199 RepID=UPI003D9A0772